MIFTSLIYPLFLLIAVGVFHLIPRNSKALWVTLCGLIFYAFYAEWFLVLIVTEAVMVYSFAKYSRERAAVTIFSVIAAVAILGYYKYKVLFANLFAASLHFKPLEVEQIVIPLALSFFTFEFIHYLVDMRQKKIERHSFLEFMAFAMFFPTMVAGPIKRFQDFIPKLRFATLSWGLVSGGLLRIAVGFAKKIIIADSMHLWVRPLTDGVTHADTTTLVISLLAYSIKIYMDFSGYSDIAIGSAALFGIIVPENFSFPYFKTNIADFWKSWHISLTRWIIDYIFIPLGGSKKGLFLACINTLIAFTLSGLWHGAGWNFAIWGFYQGVLLIICRIYRSIIKPLVKTPDLFAPISKFSSGILTFVLVTLGWGFFIMPADRFLKILVECFKS